MHPQSEGVRFLLCGVFKGSPRASRRNKLCQHLDVGHEASRTVRGYMSGILSPKFLVICYGSPRKLIQWPKCMLFQFFPKQVLSKLLSTLSPHYLE